MKIKKILTIAIILLLLIVSPFSLMACNLNRESNPSIPNYPPQVQEPEIEKNIFTYNYNEATGNNTEVNIEINKDEYLKSKLIVPTRDEFDFDGWYADWLFKTKVADNKGNIIGEELFESESKQLYAKWKKDNAPVYPILMVFVTKVNASLEMMNGDMKEIDYTMSDSERKACLKISTLLGDYLNAMMNGLVNFKVDVYFTTEVVGSKSFTLGIAQPLGSTELVYNYDLLAYNIPELGGLEWPDVNGLPPISDIESDGILSKYKTIMTTFCMNDEDSDIHVIAGSSEKKYSSIHMESLFGSLKRNGYSVDYLFDPNVKNIDIWWKGYMELYLHEFAHSVELYPENKNQNRLDYHEIHGYYAIKYGYKYGGQSGMFEVEIARLFLLCKADIDGEKFGIRKEFWFFD